jgi:hypothetical protein
LNLSLMISAANEKPTARATGGGLMSAWIKKKFLDQQPPRASAHACTTTTSTTTHGTKIGDV